MIRATRALMVLLPTPAGCAEWPRFANLPASDAVGVEPPEQLTQTASLDEPPAPSLGWPDDAVQLPTEAQRSLGGLWQVTRLVGTLAPFGHDGGGKVPFACASDASPITYSDDSDIDWVHVLHTGGPLCLVVEAAAPDSEWDVVVHTFDPDLACVTGPALNPTGSTGLPEVTTPVANSFLGDVPAGDLAIYVAGVAGGSDEVPYTVHVVPATVVESCEALELADVIAAAEPQ